MQHNGPTRARPQTSDSGDVTVAPDSGDSRRAGAAGSRASAPNERAFTRMFSLPPGPELDDATIEKLALAMTGPRRKPVHEAAFTAGYTYLGQFITHEITFDPTPVRRARVAVERLSNARTPSLDLDSLYGGGPEVSPFLYERTQFSPSARLVLGTARASTARGTIDVPAIAGGDLPRHPETGYALIGDPRNDENLLTAQMHLAFARFHNAVVDRIAASSGAATSELDRFEAARSIVVRHFQWLVLHDFLEAITGEPGIAERVRSKAVRWMPASAGAAIPVEFSAAAFRFGHSIVREMYALNQYVDSNTGRLDEVVLMSSGRFVALKDKAIESRVVVDWRHFFAIDPAVPPQLAFRIDPKIAPSLGALRGRARGDNRLQELNLRRGQMLGLPSGQSLAKALGYTPLDQGQIEAALEAAPSTIDAVVLRHTPLWFYLLCEAHALKGGKTLGPIAAEIVAEVLVRLVESSADSYFDDPSWTPTLGATPGAFTAADMLALGGSVNLHETR